MDIASFVRIKTKAVHNVGICRILRGVNKNEEYGGDRDNSLEFKYFGEILERHEQAKISTMDIMYSIIRLVSLSEEIVVVEYNNQFLNFHNKVRKDIEQECNIIKAIAYVRFLTLIKKSDEANEVSEWIFENITKLDENFLVLVAAIDEDWIKVTPNNRKKVTKLLNEQIFDFSFSGDDILNHYGGSSNTEIIAYQFSFIRKISGAFSLKSKDIQDADKWMYIKELRYFGAKDSFSSLFCMSKDLLYWLEIQVCKRCYNGQTKKKHLEYLEGCLARNLRYSEKYTVRIFRAMTLRVLTNTVTIANGIDEYVCFAFCWYIEKGDIVFKEFIQEVWDKLDSFSSSEYVLYFEGLKGMARRFFTKARVKMLSYIEDKEYAAKLLESCFESSKDLLEYGDMRTLWATDIVNICYFPSEVKQLYVQKLLKDVSGRYYDSRNIERLMVADRYRKYMELVTYLNTDSKIVEELLNYDERFLLIFTQKIISASKGEISGDAIKLLECLIKQYSLECYSEFITHIFVGEEFIFEKFKEVFGISEEEVREISDMIIGDVSVDGTIRRSLEKRVYGDCYVEKKNLLKKLDGGLERNELAQIVDSNFILLVKKHLGNNTQYITAIRDNLYSEIREDRYHFKKAVQALCRMHVLGLINREEVVEVVDIVLNLECLENSKREA